MAKLVVKKKKLGGTFSGGGSSRITSSLRPRFVEKKPPCTDKCPNGNNIREALRVVASTAKQGRTLDDSLTAAWYAFAETSPFPSVCGRVCPHPCEGGCNRKEVDGPVAINAFERAVGDYGIERRLPHRRLTEARREERIAVIGAGPGGLSCAFHLARRGYPVTVFEAFSHPGGMLRYGIPPYRLPRAVLEAEIAKIEELGVEIRCQTVVGKDLPYARLQEDYRVIFVGLGAHKGLRLGVPGEEAPNVLTGAEFLHRINSGQPVELGGRVLVIGGGDSAIDAARVARRLGAETSILYRRTIREMPAIAHEVEEAQHEGIQIDFLVAPVEVLLDAQGRAGALKCMRMELGEPDSSGRRRPVPVAGSEFTVEATAIIPAISQEPDFASLDFLREGRDWIKADATGRVPRVEGAYAGGDVLDLGLVITAIAHGRRAAVTIDAQLSGVERPGDAWDLLPLVTHEKMKLSYYERLARHEVELLPMEARFAEGLEREVSLGLTREAAVAEASRCMSCGHCLDCESCWMYCTVSAILKPDKPGENYRIKVEFCDGCKKCAEECPCGYIEMF